MHEETDGQPAQHAQDPQSIGVAHPATVIIERHVQALVGAVFNPPALTVGLEPRRGRAIPRREVGDEATVSSLRPACWRVNWAACAAKGKPMSSAATARLSRVRLSRDPLVGFHRARLGWRRGQRGKNPLGTGTLLLDVLAEGGLVVFDGQQIMRPVFHHQLAGGLVWVCSASKATQRPARSSSPEEFARHGDFVGLGIHQRAAQIELAGHGDGAQDGVPGPWLGSLPSTTINSSGGGWPRT